MEKNTSFTIWDVFYLPFCILSFFETTCWPHDPVLYCSTKPIYLFFTLDRSLILVLNGIWCLTPFCKEYGTMFYTSKKKKMLILLRFVIELQGSALLFEFAYNNSLIVIISYQRHNNLWLGKEEVDKGSLHLFSNLPTFFFSAKRDILQFQTWEKWCIVAFIYVKYIWSLLAKFILSG